MYNALVFERRFFWLFCGLVFYLTLFFQLGNLAFVGADEPRYARVAEEMNLRGQYVTPTLQFQPWLEKPPLLYWLSAASFRLFGVSEWAARLPVALFAAAAAVAAAFLALRFAGARAALFTLLILPTSGLYFVYARAASTDMPLTASFTVAMVCGFLATRSRSPVWGVAAGLALALAVLAKGPVALLLFGATFLFYFFVKPHLFWSWRQILSGAPIFLAAAVPWYWLVWKENGFDFIATFWWNHHLARFVTSIHHHSQPFWFYVAVLIPGFFPWAFFLPSAVRRLWRLRSRLWNGEELPEVFLWLWFLVPFVFFSLSESKLAGYILPGLPALALLVAVEWDHYLEAEIGSYRLIRPELAVLSAATVVLVVVLVVGFQLRYGSWAVGAVLALPLAASLVWARYEMGRRRLERIVPSLAAGMALLAALAYWQGAPRVEDYHSARKLSVLVRDEVSREQPLILYRYFHHTAQYYTGYRTTREAFSSLEALQAYLAEHPQQRYLLLTQAPGWEDLHEAYRPLLVRRQGNLYLVEIDGPGPQTAGPTFAPSGGFPLKSRLLR